MSPAGSSSRPGPSERGGYARGEETRARIITCAIRVFGRLGFEQASTREIAGEADVKPAALHYYFSGKVGLYRACVDAVTVTIAARASGLIGEVDRQLALNPDLDALIDLYCSIQDSALNSYYLPNEGIGVGMLLTSGVDAEQLTWARKLMHERVVEPVFRANVAILSRIMGRAPDDLEAGLHTFAINGIAMMFRWGRDDIVDTLGWTGLEPGALAQVQAIARTQATLVLRGLVAQAMPTASRSGQRAGRVKQNAIS